MKRLVLIASSIVALAACAEEPLGPAGPQPPAPPPLYTPGVATVFRTRDFAWSAVPGDGSILGTLAYRQGGMRYTCQGGDVILTPETAWTRRRMIILYGSPIGAAVPLEIVRARTPSAPSGDYASYAKKTTCDGANRFAFDGLPNGGWFVITLAKPADGPGEPIAVMRRVETHGGQRTVTLS
ncbi:MAG: hypothetical protein ABI306_00690 [Caulobacteraceae bacterium]